MNLQKTMSEIAKRGLTEKEALEFANNQWGMVVAWLIEREGIKVIYIKEEDLEELRTIKELLDMKLYDDMNLYETGAKDILNYLFDRKGVDGGLLENFKAQRSEDEELLCVGEGCIEPQSSEGEYCLQCFINLKK